MGIAIIKRVVGSVLCFLLVMSSTSYAANPFKKSKNYSFGSDVVWYENNDAAIKSGAVRNGSNTNYYHLIINKYQLLLRLGKNDPSGELENTRLLDSLSIIEVKADDQRLPLFNWCLQNQQNPGRKLKQNAIVANDVCINAGGGGDFVIFLDDETQNILKQAKQLEFTVEPYARPVKIVFSLSGYAPIMAQINKPITPPIVKKPVAKPVPVVVVKSKPKPKPKVKTQPKPVKMCSVKAPADFKSAVSAVSYPCKNKVKKTKAEAKVAAAVKQEKKKMAAELQAVKDKELIKQKTLEDKKRDIDWDNKQTALWVSRCQRHWAKNTSPCYCQKYIERAPAGTKDTCRK